MKFQLLGLFLEQTSGKVESNSNALRDAIGVLGPEVNKQSEFLVAQLVETRSLEDSIIVFERLTLATL